MSRTPEQTGSRGGELRLGEKSSSVSRGRPQKRGLRSQRDKARGAAHEPQCVGGGGLQPEACRRQVVGRVAGDSEEVEEVETHGESTMPLTT